MLPRRKWARLLLAMVVGAVILLPGSYAVEQYIDNARLSTALPRLAAPDRHVRLLVIAPHPDDETLGAAGLIQRVLAAGGQVRVVVITSGDGFTRSAVAFEHVLRPQPADFLRLGRDRIDESQTALKILGVPKDAVTYLGFPDGGTLSIWNDHWDPALPYQAPKTRVSHVPYREAADYGTPYDGTDLTQQLEKVIADFQPTALLVPFPRDYHSDHRAGYLFGTLAMVAQRGGWNMPVYGYIVHQGPWWPAPLGDHPSLRLSPPEDLASPDYHWENLPLTPSEQQKKRQAVYSYRSQIAVMAEWLAAFDRRNEIYSLLQPLTLPELGHEPGAPMSTWEAATQGFGTALPLIRPAVSRDWERSGDFTAVRVFRAGEMLNISAQVDSAPSPLITYRFRLITVSGGQIAVYEYTLNRLKDLSWKTLSGTGPPPPATFTAQGKTLLLQIKVPAQATRTAMLHVQASRGPLLLGRSYWQWVGQP